MMRDQEELGTAEVENRLGIEEINTRMRNWPALDFSGEQPKPTKRPHALFSLALKELKKNERQVAASRSFMPFRLRRIYFIMFDFRK